MHVSCCTFVLLQLKWMISVVSLARWQDFWHKSYQRRKIYPSKSTQKKKSSEQVFLNNFHWVSDLCHREEGKSSHKLRDFGLRVGPLKLGYHSPRKHYLPEKIFSNYFPITVSQFRFFESISAKITRSHFSWKEFRKLPARGRRALCVLVGYTMTNKQFRQDPANITWQKNIGAKITEFFRQSLPDSSFFRNKFDYRYPTWTFPNFIDLLMGLFRAAVFQHGGVRENSPLTLMGRFPSLMSRFPTLMGRLPECLNGPLSLSKIPPKKAAH